MFRNSLIGGCLLAALVAAGAAAAPFASAHYDAAYGRAMAQLPDWRGVWQLAGQGIFDPSTVEPPGASPNDTPWARERPPYNAEWEAKYQFVINEHKAGRLLFDPATNCSPMGVPRVLGGLLPYMFEIINKPDQTWMVFEYMSLTRRIYTDGHPHPPADDLWPTWTGHSVGHWEGDTLVVDTVSIRAAAYDRTGATHSDQLHLVERWRLIDPGTLENQMVLEDPVAFTRPWRVTRLYKRQPPGTRLDNIYCNDGNERNPVVEGQTTIILGGERPAAK